MQLARRNGIRPSRFHSIFTQMGKIKVLFQRFQQTGQLRLIQCSRRTAADIHTLHPLACRTHQRSRLCDLAAQRIKIRLDQMTGLSRSSRNERAVVAPRRTERNTHIQRNILRTDRTIQRHCSRCRADGKRRARRRYMKMLPQMLCRLAAAHAAFDQPARQLGRPHPGQAAPYRRLG